MSHFTDYDYTLSSSCGHDCWYDYTQDIAVSFLEKFDHNDWITLSNTWLKKLRWQN